jgi:hypothetical protein
LASDNTRASAGACGTDMRGARSYINVGIAREGR